MSRSVFVLKVYMTDVFLFARLNLPNVLISAAKKCSIAIFLPRVLMCQKRQIHFRWGTTKNRRLGTIVTSIQDSKPREKQISQSFSYCELINLLRNGTNNSALFMRK